MISRGHKGRREGDWTALGALFPALPRGRFAEHHFPSRPLRFHGPLRRLGNLAIEGVLRDPLALIQSARSETLLGYLRTADGRRHQVVVARPTAGAMFQAGATINVGNLHLWNETVGMWAASLRDELGLRPDQVICDAVVSPEGDAVPKHFDGIETLTIQLVGRKQWTVAPCPEVRYPGHSLFPEVPHNWRDGDRRLAYVPRDVDREMPADSRSFVMRPGSVQFLPRGWWHETRALEPTISLSFVLRAESWAAIVSRALTRELESQERWREPVAMATPRQRRSARLRLASLLETLPAETARLSPATLVPTSPDEEQFRTAAGVALVTTNRKAHEAVVCRLEAPGLSRPLEIETDPKTASVLAWVVRRRRPFTRRRLQAAAPGVELTRVVAMLVAAGLLSRVYPEA